MPGIRLIFILTILSVGLFVAGWQLGRSVQTPEEATLGQETTSQRITDPIRWEVIESTTRLRASLQPGSIIEVPVPSDRPPIVTRVLHDHGDPVQSGMVLIELAGRPVIVLNGILPAWRDFTPGMAAGPDIAQLQSALEALELYDGQVDGRLGPATQQAIQSLYELVGYPPLDGETSLLPMGEVFFAPPTSLTVYGTEVLMGKVMELGDVVLHDGSQVLEVIPPAGASFPPAEGMTARVLSMDGQLVVSGILAGVAPADRGDGEDQAWHLSLDVSIPLKFEEEVVLDIVMESSAGPVFSASPAAVFFDSSGPYVVIVDGGSEVPVHVEVGVVTHERIEISGNDSRISAGTDLVLNPEP